jgi:hypothetical protein
MVAKTVEKMDMTMADRKAGMLVDTRVGKMAEK